MIPRRTPKGLGVLQLQQQRDPQSMSPYPVQFFRLQLALGGQT